jgi:primosomal protein N' (replication factor Y)
MPTYVEIAVNVPQVSGVFHYHIPSELEGQVKSGCLVLVPFGQRTVQGVVLGIVDKPEVVETRPIIDLLDQEPVVTANQIDLAQHLSAQSLAPLAACIGLMIPTGIDQQADVLYVPTGDIPAGISSTQLRLLKILHKRGPLRGSQLDRAMKYTNWRAALKPLLRRSLIKTETILPEPKVKPKMVRTVMLSKPIEEARLVLISLGRKGTQAFERRQATLAWLAQQDDSIPVTEVYAETGANSGDLRFLVEHGLAVLSESQVLRDPLKIYDQELFPVPVLTRDQQAIWEEVQEHIAQAVRGQITPTLLLHGVTGSGKTEIYLRAVQETLLLGRQAIILVPEIALTPQTVRRFLGRFPGQVGLIHSGLSVGERYDTWRRARAGDLQVIVGPRSALFTPFSNLGLIVVDECHDDSYYQSESAPHYHAREAAVEYARLAKACCLMGSATPDITSMYRCQKGGWRYLGLPTRILAHREAVKAQIARLQVDKKESVQPTSLFRPLEEQADAIELPPVHIVDMRLELQAGNRSIFSRPLQQALQEVLENKQQAILFLNRRGSATYVFCRDCGETLKCPRCDIPLTYHEDQGLLQCHYCSYQRRMPDHCGHCGSTRIRHFGTGTQRVETEVKGLFPLARTLRWDFETTRKKGSHESILSTFAEHRADILVGTQMLAKGLDLPLVTLVGVVLADVGLSLPDYRTNERVFQTLTQVAGRAGRSPLGGKVILQTFQPEHYVIQAASKHDYLAFFTQELEFRRKLGYPPYTQLVRLEYRDHDSARAERVAYEMGEQVKNWLAKENQRTVRMIGPAPCFFARMGGAYRWHIVLNGPDPTKIFHGRAIGGWKIEVNPPNLL